MAGHKKDNSLGGWLLPIIFLFFIPPIGVLLIILKLLSDGKSGKQAKGRHPYYSQQAPEAPAGARTTIPYSAQSVHQKNEDVLAPLARKCRLLTVGGAIISLFFGLSALVIALDMITWAELAWIFEDIMASLCFSFGGFAMWLTGQRQKKKLRRYRQYLSTIGRRQSVSISALAKAMGRAPRTVRDDLQDMLDDGCFPAGFLDYGGDMLVLSGDGLQDPPKPQPKKEDAAQQENAVLAEIRAVNDSIANEKLSAQIDRIGVITARIFDYQKSHPERSPQLHSFLSYYLPTTLKILRAYAQLESQGVEGENISAAMGRIEGMMDKVVEGFEKQLDQLFHADAMDITSDVQVLEQMLAKDGLSSSAGGIQLNI